ncbi:MAG: hypothetical protein KDC98_01235, partial [Planctomycetes bacterium]|nr:hypothetical protein [Planctomycetota bacterium]
MIQRGIAILATLLFSALLPLGSEAVAQDQVPALSKQEVARTRFRDLTERMQQLMIVLQKDESDVNAATDAGILRAGSQYVQEVKLHEHMDRVANLLEQERWDDALTEIGEVRTKLSKLYDILQNRNQDLQQLLERIAKLEAFKNRVDDLAKEQADEKEDSARTEALQQLLKDIEAKKAQTSELLARQQAVREQTNSLGMQAAAEATKPLETKEGELEEDTAKLAADLADIEAKKAELDAGKPGENGKAGKPEAPSEAKPGESGKGKAGSGSASKAAGAMGKAEAQLGDNQPEPSLKDMDHAIENLQQTLQEL